MNDLLKTFYAWLFVSTAYYAFVYLVISFLAFDFLFLSFLGHRIAATVIYLGIGAAAIEHHCA